MSGNEKYQENYADPSIFKKSSQKDGGFWTVADEYTTHDLNSPSINWLPADNNEFATRNRINELLKPSSLIKHPVTGLSPAPSIYFVRRSDLYPYGCNNAIIQIKSQRRKKLGDDNGKPIYSDDREESVADHAYDAVRYAVATHGSPLKEKLAQPPRRSFAYYKKLAKFMKYRESRPLA